MSIPKDEEMDAWIELRVNELRLPVLMFNRLWLITFSKLCNNGLFTLKFHTIDHMVEDFCGFETRSVLEA